VGVEMYDSRFKVKLHQPRSGRPAVKTEKKMSTMSKEQRSWQRVYAEEEGEREGAGSVCVCEGTTFASCQAGFGCSHSQKQNSRWYKRRTQRQGYVEESVYVGVWGGGEVVALVGTKRGTETPDEASRSTVQPHPDPMQCSQKDSYSSSSPHTATIPQLPKGQSPPLDKLAPSPERSKWDLPYCKAPGARWGGQQ
jgi:hypothetical protein